MKIPSSIWTLLIGIGLTLISLWYGQNHGLLPVAASESASLVDGLFNTMMTISTGIFILVEGVLIICAFKFRRRPGDNTDGPPVEGNVPLEILWTGIPAIIVIVLSVYSFEVYNSLGGINPHAVHEAVIKQEMTMVPGSAMAATLTENHEHHHMGKAQTQIAQAFDAEDKPADIFVKITGLQYAFLFSYPETGITAGELHLPIGKKAQINMTANDVIHAFWVPEFRLKQDAIPGRESEFSFTPTKIGNYALICAELCGPYHGAMRSQVIVQSQEDFDKWQQEQVVAAKAEINQAIALNPTEKSVDNFLAPYTQNMGIKPELLKQISQ
ncbi:cytochrome c oxidase subunit II [Calothrix sp. 336/3]|uniref:cytochrome c oxidase subunit II n=1 Tax=Calothrix sp. 336/3 TaxID=1337936 RepID=UPI0004E2BE9D|nr:cytochrome c oxidase subunit II [Calothrix sp. 336/3]AKG21919.1 cytochrome C oxidase subunit II [Calothrix sp. 336/3]